MNSAQEQLDLFGQIPVTEFCHKCKRDKPLSDFHKCRWRKHGVHWWCKECRRTHEKNLYRKPPKTSIRWTPPPTDTEKICSKCRAWKPFDAFRPRSDRPTRMNSECRVCEDEYRLRSRRERRQKVIEHYGGKCVYCEEDRLEYLEMDHVNNDGKFHRMRNSDKGNASEICGWLIKHNFPNNFQILCTKCNLAKSRFSGEMPPLFKQVGSLAWKQAIHWLVSQMGGRDAVLAEVQSLSST